MFTWSCLINLGRYKMAPTDRRSGLIVSHFVVAVIFSHPGNLKSASSTQIRTGHSQIIQHLLPSFKKYILLWLDFKSRHVTLHLTVGVRFTCWELRFDALSHISELPPHFHKGHLWSVYLFWVDPSSFSSLCQVWQASFIFLSLPSQLFFILASRSVTHLHGHVLPFLRRSVCRSSRLLWV